MSVLLSEAGFRIRNGVRPAFWFWDFGYEVRYGIRLMGWDGKGKGMECGWW